MIFRVIFFLSVINAVICLPQPPTKRELSNEIDTSLADSSYVHFLYKCRDIAIRIRKFTETVERILPKEISEEVNGNKTVTARINLFIGIRHFVMGIKQIASTLENVLSGGDSGESKQLSQAPLVPSELFHSLVNAIQFVASMIRRLVMSYNYYLPELEITQCMYSYMGENYPGLYIYEYPGQIFNDVYDYLQGMVSEEQAQTREVDALVYEDTLEEEGVPNSTVETYYNDAENEIFGSRALESPRFSRSKMNPVPVTSARWQSCSKIYLLEAAFRYSIVNFLY